VAIEIPGPVQPFYELFGPPFPDINEDGFHDLRKPLRRLPESLIQLCDSIETALVDFASSNPALSADALVAELRSIRQQYLRPFEEVCDDIAGEPIDIGFDFVVGVKTACLTEASMVAYSVMAELAASFETMGASDAVAIAEVEALKEATDQSLRIAEGDLTNLLISQLQSRIDNALNSVVNPFLDRIVNNLEKDIDGYTDRFARRGGVELSSFSEQTFHVSATDLWNCSSRIDRATYELELAISEFREAINSIFEESSSGGSNPDPGLRLIAHSLVKDFLGDLSDAAHKLVSSVIQHFVKQLRGYAEAVDSMDHQIASTSPLGDSPQDSGNTVPESSAKSNHISKSISHWAIQATQKRIEAHAISTSSETPESSAMKQPTDSALDSTTSSSRVSEVSKGKTDEPQVAQQASGTSSASISTESGVPDKPEHGHTQVGDVSAQGQSLKDLKEQVDKGKKPLNPPGTSDSGKGIGGSSGSRSRKG
jgi:hypothetical protein